MRILALETTEPVGSLAAASDDKLLGQLQLNPQKRSAAALAPAMQDLLKTAGWRPADVELVAVTVGPGSFTGLRVGVTTAKVFAYATGAAVLGVDTLQTIATGAPDDVVRLSAAIDAQRGDVVAQPFSRNAAGWFEPAGPQELLSIDTWLAGLAPGTALAGPVLEKLSGRLPEGMLAVEPRYWRPQAACVARLAGWLYAAGRRDDVWSLVPRYSRRSAAEEKWEKTRGKQ